MRNLVHLLWVTAFVVMLAGPAAAQSEQLEQSAQSAQPEQTTATRLPKIVGWGIAAGMALHGGDAMQTAYCLGTRECREGNPALAPFSNHPFWFGFTKLGIATGVNYAAIKLRKEHPYWALLIVGAEISLETYAVIHNNRLFPPAGR